MMCRTFVERNLMSLEKNKVRKLLSEHIWLEDKERLAHHWLELRSTSLAREANDLAKRANDLAKRANDVAREANDIARRNNSIAALTLIGAGVAIIVSILGIFLKRG